MLFCDVSTPGNALAAMRKGSSSKTPPAKTVDSGETGAPAGEEEEKLVTNVVGYAAFAYVCDCQMS